MREKEFNLQPSQFFIALLIIVQLACLIIILTVKISWWVKISLFLLVCLYGINIFWRDALLRSNRAIHTIKRLTNDEWQVITKRGKFSAYLCGDSTVTAYVSILKFKYSGKRILWPISCVIFPDSLKPGDYRKLLVTLKCG